MNWWKELPILLETKSAFPRIQILSYFFFLVCVHVSVSSDDLSFSFFFFSFSGKQQKPSPCITLHLISWFLKTSPLPAYYHFQSTHSWCVCCCCGTFPKCLQAASCMSKTAAVKPVRRVTNRFNPAALSPATDYRESSLQEIQPAHPCSLCNSDTESFCMLNTQSRV